MVAIDRACTSLNFFESSGHYAVNILEEGQRAISHRFAELPEGRFAGVAWSLGIHGAPVLEGVLAVLECRTKQMLDSGDHRIFIGEVTAAAVHHGRPLLYFNSDYSKLG
jgi:flavin reductase (DIM6/NTAB) family NADH-FMN oxidoreductase RutF